MRWVGWLVVVGCSSSPASAPAPEAAAPAVPAAAASALQLAPAGEPGQALMVTGILVRADDQTPLAGQRFLVYQSDASGDYRASDPADERTARLRAHVTTDAAGRFALQTILPGAYGDPPGDPHLHIEVLGARPSMHSIYFEGFVQKSTIDWAKTTEQGHIVPVTRGPDGAIAARLTLPVRGVAR
jgi:protocatechuate 3,4-dioxygenase beta subunit